MRFHKGARLMGLAALLLTIVVLGSTVQIAGLGQAGENYVDVYISTRYFYGTRQVGSIPNQELIGKKDTCINLYNSKDLTGEDVKDPVLTFTTTLPVIGFSDEEYLIPGTTYTWEFLDLLEEESHDACVEFASSAPSGAFPFTPGFSVDYSLDPLEFSAPGGTQEVEITVIPQESGLKYIDIGVSMREDERVIPTISFYAAPERVWVSPEKDTLWLTISDPRVGARYTLYVTIDVELKDKVELARNQPTVRVEAKVSEGEGKEAAKNSFTRTMATDVGTWEWTTSDPYTWNWTEWLEKGVRFQGFSVPGFRPPTKEAIDAAIRKGLDWLDQHQNDDGSWNYYRPEWESPFPNVGVTAQAAFAFLQYGYPESDPTVSKAIQYILEHQHDDGSFYSNQHGSPTYETSLSILALLATGNPDYSDEIANAVDWLVEAQNDEDKDYAKYGYEGFSCPDPDTCPAYGGWNYNLSGVSHTEADVPYLRSDNSNTQFALMALWWAGLPADSDVWEKAEDWVTRCQNLDGGFTYMPPELKLLEGGRPGGSYGSMTAAGVWELGVIGVPLDDPRIQKGLNWLRRNYVYHENPECGTHWHFYYLWSATRAFLHSGFPGVLEPGLPPAGWFYDFGGYLVEYQQDDGSWMSADEDEPPEYATSLALLVLGRVAIPAP